MAKYSSLKLNTISALLTRICIMLSGFILPKLIINTYGSEINGLVETIRNYLSVITFLDFGVGAVVQSRLYQPIIEKNFNEVSKILSVARTYFRTLSYILLLYIIGLIIFIPNYYNIESFSIISTVFLIVSLSISIFSQYFFGIVNEFFLNANQLNYIQLFSESLVVILNIISTIILINLGFSIEIVKFLSGIIFLIRPIYLNYYVKNHYNLKKIKNLNSEEVLPNKWSGMGQHIAYSIQNSIELLLVSLFTSLKEVSSFSIYKMIVGAINLIVTSLTDGLMSFFGHLLALGRIEELRKQFTRFEWLIHNIVVILFGITVNLLDSFVNIYLGFTNDFSSNKYFIYLIVISSVIKTLKLPYRRLLYAAGHFKETEKSSYLEAGLNFFISLILINLIGINGVLIGAIIANLYRLLYKVYYLQNNIIMRSVKIFYKQILFDICLFMLISFVGQIITYFCPIYSLFQWVFTGFLLTIIAVSITVFFNYILYKKELISFFKRYSDPKKLD